jgi:hypothetical protein
VVTTGTGGVAYLDKFAVDAIDKNAVLTLLYNPCTTLVTTL